MFHKIFSQKKKSFFLKRSESIKNVSLNGKIITNHCTGHNTMILIILIDGFKERTIRLYESKKSWKYMYLFFTKRLWPELLYWKNEWSGNFIILLAWWIFNRDMWQRLLFIANVQIGNINLKWKIIVIGVSSIKTWWLFQWILIN